MKLDFLSDINKENYYALSYDLVDRFMVKWCYVSAFLLSLYAFLLYLFEPAKQYPSPFAWRVVSFSEVFWVIVLAVLTALAAALLKGRVANHYLWRFLITNLVLVYPYLVVFISGGSIEWHFHFFVTLAVLVLYADWRLGAWAVVAVGLHHGILNFVAPNWVYFYGRNDIAFLSHALLVSFMAIVMTLLAERLKALADTNRKLAEKIGGNATPA